MSTQSETKVEVIEGYVDFDVPDAGAECKTWYQIHKPVQTESTTNGTAASKRPLVVLHGGPGIPHIYLDPLKNLASLLNQPVIFYDQLGCGNSTHLKHKTGDDGAAFWKPELFIKELDNLLAALGIQDDYDLLGQSWGGMLATLHSIRQPKGLHKLILANTPSSVKLFMEETTKLREQLPKDIRDILDKGEKEKDYNNPDFKNAIMVFYSLHVCRLAEMPDELLQAMGAIEEDNTVYMSMNGPSEFIITGTIQSFDTREDAHKINRPTLLLNGRYDEVTDSTVAPLFSAIEKVKWFTFAESSHMPWFEEPKVFNEQVIAFLKE